MGIKSKPYYWLECDDCGRKSTQDSDYAAWADVSQARDDAVYDGDWLNDGPIDWCGECRDKHACRECNKVTDNLKFEDETAPGYWPMCPDCREEA